ncbi:MAG TPA: hypothetical protein VHS05_03100 [Pyrinomonadaceae bacterium]|jgi:hypothetical protein|nr:hypothetical protein [Pyrinomonadaceae bacterium]
MERKESVGKDATSKKTVEDLEELEVSDEADNNDLPSPDGELDESDELKDADPV